MHVVALSAGDVSDLVIGGLTDVEEDVVVVVQQGGGFIGGHVLHLDIGCRSGNFSAGVGGIGAAEHAQNQDQAQQSSIQSLHLCFLLKIFDWVIIIPNNRSNGTIILIICQ